MYIGSELSGIVKDRYTEGIGETAVTNWTGVWMAPTYIALAVLVLFVLFFKGGKKKAVV